MVHKGDARITRTIVHKCDTHITHDINAEYEVLIYTKIRNI